MSRVKSVQKVVGFVTRRTGPNAELLLLGHPNAGVQLPAGTVEFGETPVQAVSREVKEETGLTVQIKRLLGQVVEQLPEDQRVIVRMTKLFDAPSYDASSEGYGLKRGSPVRVTGVFGKFAAVECEPLDASREPPIRLAAVNGYVRLGLLADRLERHLFELSAFDHGPDEWQVFSDGHQFQLFWTPLRPKPVVVAGQATWLDIVYDKLLEPHGGPRV